MKSDANILYNVLVFSYIFYVWDFMFLHVETSEKLSV